ncbi:MAG: S41 family peptidase [Anaerolineae bacterium]
MRAFLKVSVMIVVAAIVVSGAFLVGFGYSWVMTGGVTPVIAGAEPPKEFRIFWEAWHIIEREFFGEVPGPQEMTYGAIRGMIRSLDDPHTVFIEPGRTTLDQADFKGQFEGIGATVTMENEYLVIVSPLQGSPAMRAGLMPGDIVLKVDDTEIAGMSVEEAVLLIRGPKGTTVKLTILRQGVAEPLVFEIVRDVIALPTARWQVVAEDIGYIRLSLFSEKTKDELVSAIKELKGEGVEALILDMRNNPGGLLEASIDVASQFLSEGVVAYRRDKDGNEQPFPVRGGGQATELPLVVLVNGGTASASEIVAGAIQDYERGTLIGETTFGKGAVANVHELSDGSSIHVTVAQWLTPNKKLLSGQGLVPDISIPISDEDIQAGRDPQLQRAIEYLKGGQGLPTLPHHIAVVT